MSRPSPADLTLADLSLRLAQELDAAAQACHSALALAADLAEKAAAPVQALGPLQALDETTQRLEALSLVLQRLSPLAGVQAVPDSALLADIGLSDLADRLRGVSPAKPTTAPGEAELF